MGQGISYAPQMTINSQALANFIAEWTNVQMPPAAIDQEYWMMYFDGSLMKRGTGARLVFILPLRIRMKYVVCLHFSAYNNVAKYEAFIIGLCIALELGIRWLDF